MQVHTARRGIGKGFAWSLALGLWTLARATAAEPDPPSSAAADAHLAAGRFAEAATAYEALAAADPQNGRAWFRLGFARHELSRFREALAAFARSEPLHAMPQFVAYRIARSHARLGEAEEALAALERAISLGFNLVDQLRDDQDLRHLRDQPRFAAALAAAAREANPCALDPIYRAADFMVGDWQVWQQGSSIGHARIAPAVGGCAVVEEYAQPNVSGADGRVMTYFDAQARRWRQMYVDASGNAAELWGEATATGMVLFGEHRPRRGETHRLRIRLEKLASGGFRQLSELSRDGGETWQPLYDLRYLPPAPPPGGP